MKYSLLLLIGICFCTQIFSQKSRLFFRSGFETNNHIIQLNPYFDDIKDSAFTYLKPTNHDNISNNIPMISSPFPYCQSNPNPIGGGSGYDDIFLASDADILINEPISALDFKATIENADAGTLIYIEDDLTIDLSNLYDLTGAYSIFVPSDITIASGRGKNGQFGALIMTNDYEVNANEFTGAAQPLFQLVGNNIRFTGIRFQGPFQEIGNISQLKVKSCIRIMDGYFNLEVDNCIFYGWPFCAVKIGGFQPSQSSYKVNNLHHNYFYNNRQSGYGYGVLVDRGYAKIDSNIFKANRHDIAGTGKGKCSYEASCNSVLGNGTGHNFDMHAEGHNDQSENAGHYLFIHHNDFRDIGDDRGDPWNIQNIYIRGRLNIQCRIENNKFAHIDPNVAILQLNGHGGYGNILVWNNIYGNNKYLGWYVKKEWLKDNTDNFLNIPSSNDVIMTNPSNGSNYSYSYTFGDYDGNGKTDIFKWENNKLYTIPLETSINTINQNWKFLININSPMSNLKFLFYNEDQFTDILKVNKSREIISTFQIQNSIDLLLGKIGDSGWISLMPTNYDFFDFLFGDFDENGVSDLFVTDNSIWKVSYNSNSSWQNLNSSNFSLNYLLLGKFNQNFKSDVFVANSQYFGVSYDGIGKWVNIATSNYITPDLLIVDFNGDNFSDVIHKNNRQVLLYSNSIWQDITTSNFPIVNFSFGNF